MSQYIWDKASQELVPIAGLVNINDSSVTDDTTWSSEKIQSSLVDLGTYSTSKEIKVGTWIDGKPIYRTVADLSNMSFSKDTQEYTVDFDKNIDSVVNLKGIGRSNRWWFSAPQPTWAYSSNTWKANIMYDITNKKISLRLEDESTSGGSWIRDITKLYVIIEYTKNS